MLQKLLRLMCAFLSKLLQTAMQTKRVNGCEHSFQL